MKLECQLMCRTIRPFFNTTTGQRTFLANGPRLGNDLARNIRGLSTMAKFENELHKHFLDCNFENDHFIISRSF